MELFYQGESVPKAEIRTANFLFLIKCMHRTDLRITSIAR